MSAASVSTMGPSAAHHRPSSRRGRRWTPPNTIATVLAFVFFGPLGLFVLAWVLSGRDVVELPGAARRLWASVSGDRDGWFDRFGSERIRTGNAVFDDYQRTQLDRIREIREELRTRTRRFEEFRASAQRRADEEEFQRFMASAPDGA